MRLLFAIVASLATTCAFALQVPEATKSDPHVGYVVYDPDNIVQIEGVPGYQTFVLFSEGETVLDLGFGFSKAWDIGVVRKGNGFFIKPALQNPDTNLTVITNRREYNFLLVTRPDTQKATVKIKIPPKFFQYIKYRYPQDEARAQAQAAKVNDVEKTLTTAGRGKYRNENYWVQGTKALWPIAAWDDGTFTHLTFAPNTDLPVPYAVDSQDREIRVNWHKERDTLVVHRISPKLKLRRDGEVIAIFNESYDSFGIENESNTASPVVKRVIREDAQETDMNPVTPSAVTPAATQPQAATDGKAASTTLGGK